MNSPNLLLVGSIVGSVAGVAITIVGLYLGDRWVAVVGLVAAIAFGASIAYFGMLV